MIDIRDEMGPMPSGELPNLMRKRTSNFEGRKKIITRSTPRLIIGYRPSCQLDLSDDKSVNYAFLSESMAMDYLTDLINDELCPEYFKNRSIRTVESTNRFRSYPIFTPYMLDVLDKAADRETEKVKVRIRKTASMGPTCFTQPTETASHARPGTLQGGLYPKRA